MWYFQVMGPVKSKPVLTMKIEHCLQLSVQAAVELNRNETEKKSMIYSYIGIRRETKPL